MCELHFAVYEFGPVRSQFVMISISNQTRLVNSYRIYCQTWSCYIESREGHVNGAMPKLHNDIRISNALL